MINISTRVLRALIVLDELRHFSLAAEHGRPPLHREWNRLIL